MDYTPLSTLALPLRLLYLLEAAVLVAGAFFPGRVLLAAGLVLFVAIAGLFVAWLHQATENLQAFGRGGRFGPGWAVGAWFLPMANAVVPYLMVADVWERSTAPSPTAGSGRTPGSITAWWMVFVGSLTLLGAQPGFGEAELIAPKLLLATAALLGEHAVRRLSQHQDRAAAARLGTAGVTPLPVTVTAGARRILAAVSASMLVVWGAALAATAVMVILAVNLRAAKGGEAPSSTAAPAILLAATAAAVVGAAALGHHPRHGHESDRP